MFSGESSAFRSYSPKRIPETVNPSAFFNTCPVRQQSLRIQIALGIVTSADPYKKSFPKSVIGIFGFMSILYTSPGEKSTGNRKNVNIRRKHGKSTDFLVLFYAGRTQLPRKAANLGELSIVHFQLSIGKVLVVLAVLGRGHAVALFEPAGEIELVTEAKPCADIMDRYGL